MKQSSVFPVIALVWLASTTHMHAQFAPPSDCDPFVCQGIDPDIAAVRAAANVLSERQKANLDQYRRWPGPEPSWAFKCADSSHQVASDILDDACKQPGQPLNGWHVDNIVSILEIKAPSGKTYHFTCENATMLSNPGRTRQYAIDLWGALDQGFFPVDKQPGETVDGRPTYSARSPIGDRITLSCGPEWSSIRTTLGVSDQDREFLLAHTPKRYNNPLFTIAHNRDVTDGRPRLHGTITCPNPQLTAPPSIGPDTTFPGACPLSDTGAAPFQGATVSAIDPNDKTGSQGFGALRYIEGTPASRYAVVFENLSAATAPAQSVVITDHLDAGLFDVQTLSLGPITIGNRTIVPPPAVSNYSGTIDLRPAKNLLVRIDARFDSVTNVLTWTLTSIDPATNKPPEDPLAGFLPPNRNPPEGEGSLLFTITPRQNLPTGTQIRNRASITFDSNAPILTPEWFNTIDNSLPASRVLALPPAQPGRSFSVSWQGSDIGSGIRDYTIYVADNDGPFTPWLANTRAISDTYSGVAGHTYRFYSIARDLTGNIEPTKTAAEATTRVVVDVTPPLITSNVSGTLGNNGWYRSNVTVNWTVTDPESGIASSNGCSPTTLTNDTAGTTLTCSATDGVGLVKSVPITIKIDKAAPVITGMPTTGCTLWPPNHTLVQVGAVVGSDALSGLAAFAVTVTSNEPENGTGDGDTAPDIVITGSGLGPRVVQLRAERAGTGTGRIYTLAATASDQAGNSVTARAACTVPLSQSR